LPIGFPAGPVTGTESGGRIRPPAAARPVLAISGQGLPDADSKSDLVAQIEIVTVPSERQAKHDYGCPYVARDQKARGRKKQRNVALYP
jgi:hypothetical protein